jgi:UDP-N-acetylmuramoylalanine--D-glutamate ligase
VIEWLGNRVGVYGYGKTGKAAVEFLAPRLIRPQVFVDETDPQRLATLQAQAGEHCDILGSDQIAAAVEQLDSLILSPGVPLHNPNVQRAFERGILVISELELAARFCPGHILAITGTNGKSTTTKLLGHILEAVGPTHVLGNIGTPLLGSLDLINPGDFVALEVSSFQLEAIDRFAPHVAIYTNLTPDHLDRHGSMEEYARVKRNMTRRMDAGDFVVTNASSPEFAPAQFENQAPTFLEYSAGSRSGARGAWLDGSRIRLDLGREQYDLPLDCIKLPGQHNLENALAAATTALLMGATAETVADRLAAFTGYEHRLELCRTAGNLRFFNDSKATNPESTIVALKAMQPPLALILGGRDKLTSLADMLYWVGRTATHVVLIGEASERFADALAETGYTAVSRAQGLEQAVPRAVEALGSAGGTVLLSPACASFDQYNSYEERGEHFKRIVAGLQL